jgi:hypothetical protein
MKLKQSVLLGLTLFSLGLSIYGCSGGAPENADDKKAAESAKTSSAPDGGKGATGGPSPKTDQLPPPK